MNSTVKSYIQLVKLRLTVSVVATSAFGYILACKINEPEIWTMAFQWKQFAGVLLGGLFIVFASNGLNQLIERDNDGKMQRTNQRPVVAGDIPAAHARIFSWACFALGVMLLAFTTNFTSTLLGIVSFGLYVFVYTPMKGMSPLAVMVGAVPGALPPLIGYTALTGRINEPGMILFLVQFFWQFPHFWAIAWLLHDDYQKAGYWLLPSGGGRDKKSAYQILIYTVLLVLISLMPVYYHHVSTLGLALLLPLGLFIIWRAFRLFKTLEIREAKKLLYTSLAYTPLVFLTYILF
ncbi:MAG: protoheme IX farnesyltransferase [Bacteroidia bacterium]|nr:protoheme IX farnesyltransferase [Bacteroidia bacterium]